MSGYTPTPTECIDCGQAVFPHSANELTIKRGGEWVTTHYHCPAE